MLNQTEIARQIFYGLRKHRFINELDKVPFDEIPHGLKAQLLDMADMIPKDNPMSIIVRLRKWTIKTNNFRATNTIDSFIEMEKEK